MLLNILVATFAGSFIAIAALGHVLLITAIWPDLFGKLLPEPQHHQVADPGEMLVAAELAGGKRKSETPAMTYVEADAADIQSWEPSRNQDTAAGVWTAG